MKVTMGIKVPAGLTLLEGERPYWYGRMSWKASWDLILLGILTIWAYGFGLLLFLLALSRVLASEYFVTNQRVYIKYGLLAKRAFEIKIEWITDVVVRQGVMGKILNYGNIIISISGQYTGSVIMAGVSDPMHIKTIIDDILRKSRKSRK